MYSSDPKKRKKPHGEITPDKHKSVSSSAAMVRLNANGDSMSRRHHYATVNKENN